jgi:hypothetical protein
MSVAHLVAALAAMFVVLPFADEFAYGHFLESAAFTVVLLAGVSAVGGTRRTLIVAALLVAPAVLTRWLNHFWPGLAPPEVSLFAAFIFVSFVIWHLFRFVMTAPTVDTEVLCAAISAYLLLGVLWSFLYTLVAHFDPDAFAFTLAAERNRSMSGFTAIYFSFESITTIAFGDILPVSNFARMLVLLEAVTGMFYMTIMIARLVGLYSSEKSEKSEK